MQRFTISLDDKLAQQFDGLIAHSGYDNRSEAVRDLIRERLDRKDVDELATSQCSAIATYVYDHHDHTVMERLLSVQHEHHDLVVTSQHVHLDHDHCLETVVLRGPTKAVRACGEQLVALRGVHHGRVHYIPLASEGRGHRHPHGPGAKHKHFTPSS
ncbi:nickel-responsive transcriptional regulator NikR [Caenimonas koreensis]|uniref:nickel-responsive transcriptional regulator NikR n=1 Tax=Caenimonas koreensis TaxID=367474 RepID=UPI0037832FAA